MSAFLKGLRMTSAAPMCVAATTSFSSAEQAIMMIGSDGLDGANLAQQAERVLLRFVFCNVPVHQQQVRRRRLLQAPLEHCGICVEAHLKAVLENTLHIIQDCRIAIEHDDVWTALALRLHCRSSMRSCHSQFLPHLSTKSRKSHPSRLSALARELELSF